jgi:hypothetical protein
VVVECCEVPFAVKTISEEQLELHVEPYTICDRGGAGSGFLRGRPVAYDMRPRLRRVGMRQSRQRPPRPLSPAKQTTIQGFNGAGPGGKVPAFGSDSTTEKSTISIAAGRRLRGLT